MASRYPSRIPIRKEIRYRAEIIDRWPASSRPPTQFYEFILLAVASSRPGSPMPNIDDLRMSPPTDDSIPIIPTVRTVKRGEPQIGDPRLVKNPDMRRYATNVPTPSESSPYPTSHHYYYEIDDELLASEDLNLNDTREPLTPQREMAPDAPAKIQKWPKVTNLDQIVSPTASQMDTCRLQKWTKPMPLSLVRSPPRKPKVVSRKWIELKNMDLPPDPYEIF